MTAKWRPLALRSSRASDVSSGCRFEAPINNIIFFIRLACERLFNWMNSGREKTTKFSGSKEKKARRTVPIYTARLRNSSGKFDCIDQLDFIEGKFLTPRNSSVCGYTQFAGFILNGNCVGLFYY